MPKINLPQSPFFLNEMKIGQIGQNKRDRLKLEYGYGENFPGQ